MHRSAIIGAALSCALALGGCAAGEPAPGPPAEPRPPAPAAPDPPEDAAHTATDRAFAEQLRRHHRQALDLLALSRTGTRNPAVAAYAAQAEGPLRAELAELEAWLAASSGAQSGSAPQDAAATSAAPPGELSAPQLAALRAARDAGFDRGFAQAMAGLTDGAEQLAQAELDEGSAPPMRALAERLLDRQEAERAALAAI